MLSKNQHTSESPLRRYFSKAGVGPETNELQEKKDFQ